MPEYKATFNKWASTYDEQMSRASPTDDWMFGGYDRVLDRTAEYCSLENHSYTSALEIGIGTGNLAARFLTRGIHVCGIDPSRKMRKACRRKYPDIKVLPGDFLKCPRSLPPADVIVSAYAFHHLTEKEKLKAIPLMKKRLNPLGRIVIADFMFRNAAEKELIAKSVYDKSRVDILDAFDGEYPPLFEDLVPAFQKQGFAVDGEQLTVSVWIIRACL